ncbi:MAG: hypothetical protein AAB425_15570, partial [Bdellovibrionota bacterium]
MSGISSVTQIATGAPTGGSFGIRTGGELKAWGQGSIAHLGNNSIYPVSGLQSVYGLGANVTKVASGPTAACAVVGGAVKCWGENGDGQLGGNYISTATSFLSTSPALGYLEAHSTAVSAPVSVSGISEGATSVAVGLSSSCAILNTGALKCWGSQAGGLLGDNTIAGTSPVPVQVSGLSSGVAGVGVGFRNACAISNTGALTCWGNNGNGQIGDNTLTLRRVPTQVSGLTSGVSAVALSGAVGSVCAIVSGAVKCWGYNDYGTIGDNTTTPKAVPTQVSGLTSGFVQVAFGKHHVCALKSDSTIYCWGYNQFGQL